MKSDWCTTGRARLMGCSRGCLPFCFRRAIPAAAVLAVFAARLPGLVAARTADVAPTPVHRAFRVRFLAPPGTKASVGFSMSGNDFVVAGLPGGHKLLGWAYALRPDGTWIRLRRASGDVSTTPCGADHWAVVGSGSIVGNGSGALLWLRPFDRAPIQLAPPRSLFSEALGVHGNHEVGFVIESPWPSPTRNPLGPRLAAAWAGSAASYVNLNPPGYLSSVVSGTNGRFLVGWGRKAGKPNCALLWRSEGPGATVLKCGPGFDGGKALAISSGGTIVGFGRVAKRLPRALMWTSPTKRAVDITPLGYRTSQCTYAAGRYLVGWASVGKTGGMPRAVLWLKSGRHFVDLQALLTAGYDTSCAWSVDRNGDVVGAARKQSTGLDVAVEWMPLHRASRTK